MPTHILASARTPWVRRHGPLSGTHPDELLRIAATAAVERAGLEWRDVGLFLVVCDSPVGAQASNIARRVLESIGAEAIPGVTLDGQHVGDLIALELALHRRGPTLIAAVESTSIVAPGAALVRDYGRPSTTRRPDLDIMEGAAAHAGLDRSVLDVEAAVLARSAAAASAAIVPVAIANRSEVTADIGAEPGEAAELGPLGAADGLLTAAHQANLADGAVAMVIDPSAGRAISAVDVAGVAVPDAPARVAELAANVEAGVVLADSWAVTSALARARGARLLGADDGITPVLGAGSVPSADGLRVIADAAATVTEPFVVIRRGRGGQIAVARVGAAG